MIFKISKIITKDLFSNLKRFKQLLILMNPIKRVSNMNLSQKNKPLKMLTNTLINSNRNKKKKKIIN